MNRWIFLKATILIPKKLIPNSQLQINILHIDARVTVIVDAFAVFYDEYLGRFVVDVVYLGDLIRYGAVTNEVEKVEQSIRGWRGAFQSSFGNIAGAAAMAVFENDYRLRFALFVDLGQLGFVGKKNPVHYAKIMQNELDTTRLMLKLFVLIIKQTKDLVIAHYQPYFVDIIRSKFVVEAKILVVCLAAVNRISACKIAILGYGAVAAQQLAGFQ
jgi:hypothetical protein